MTIIACEVLLYIYLFYDKINSIFLWHVTAQGKKLVSALAY